MRISDEAMQFLRQVLSDHPQVTRIEWIGGEVYVNGEVTGKPVIFEPLWDFFVGTPEDILVWRLPRAKGGRPDQPLFVVIG